MSERTPSPSKPPSSRERELIDAARAAAVVAHKGDTTRFGPSGPLPQNFSGFEVVREIHRGGQGVVYQAIQKATKRKVAIKVFHEGPFASERDRARFEREVDILAQLDHPNVVGIIDRGVADNGSFYFVMEYVSGSALDAHMADSGKSIEEILTLFAKICEAVNAAHLKGIIHRDLKPSNIRVDAEGEPHILDFGLAKIAAGEVTGGAHPQLMTMTGQFVGSLPWASPEQASGGSNIDVRTDVYSLGVILFQMLTGGRFPYAVVGNMRDVLDNIIQAEPARPSTIRRKIGDEVETIVLKCLTKDRERRYQTAGELGRDTRRYLAGEPIEAKRDSGWYLLGKTISRHKLPMSAAAGFVLLSVVSALVMSVLYREASAARGQAEQRRAAAVVAANNAEQERTRAEENFRSVRELARTFIFSFDQEISKLRGTTRAREKILTSALEYLAKMKDQAGDDPEFMAELAEAYEKVGDIQAGLFLPNVGGSLSADASYRESRRIREELLAKSPQNPALIRSVAESMRMTSQTLRREQQLSEARAELRAAADRLVSASALAANDPEELTRIRDARAHLNLDLADVSRRLAESTDAPNEATRLFNDAIDLYMDSQSHWRGRIAADPADQQAARELGQALDDHAKALLGRAQARRRVIDRQAREDAAGALREYPAAILLFEESQSLARTALSEFESLSELSPANAELRRDQFIAAHHQGEAAMWTGYALQALAKLQAPPERDATLAQARQKLLESLGYFEQALTIAKGLSSSDEANLQARRDVALALNKVGTVSIDLERWDESRQKLDESLAVRDELFRTDATQSHRRDLAQGLAKRGLLDAMRLQAGLVNADERAAVIDQTEALFGRALDHYVALRDAGVLAADAPEIRNATRWIETVRGLRSGPARDP